MMQSKKVDSELHLFMRASTKLLHQKLDHHPLLASLLCPQLSLAQYLSVLRAMYGFIKPLELDIDVFLARKPNLFDYSSRRKVPLMEADLAYLQKWADFNLNDTLFWPRRKIDSLAELVGILYCLEGSMLGARVITRQLRLNLPKEALPAITYFSGYGDETAARWANFWTFAERSCETQAQHQEAAHYAARLFNEMNSHFSACFIESTADLALPVL